MEGTENQTPTVTSFSDHILFNGKPKKRRNYNFSAPYATFHAIAYNILT